MISQYMRDVIAFIKARIESVSWDTAARVFEFIAAEEKAGRTKTQVIEDVIAKLEAGGF